VRYTYNSLEIYVDVELLFLPPYSPNLNVIERLWKFVKKNALNSKYYRNFNLFKEEINDCLKNLGTKFKKEILSLMTLKFHVIRNGTL
jgi:transposase